RHPVVDEHPAVAVEDPPAGGGDLDLPDPVGLGDDLVVLGGHDLQVPEAGEKRGEHAEHHEPEDGDAQARGVRAHRMIARARTLSPESVAQRATRSTGCATTAFSADTTSAIRTSAGPMS